MTVPPVTQSNAAIAAKMTEAREVGPDRDGDGDDAAKVAAPTKAAPAPGTGLKVDKSA